MPNFILAVKETKVQLLNEEVDPEKFKAITSLLDIDSEFRPDPVPDPVPDPTPEPQDGIVDFFWPTEHPGMVTQAFGLNPQWYERWGVPAHEGLDLRAPTGSKIFAVWDGVVVRNEEHVAYGNSIRLHHTIEGRVYESIYAHFETPSPLKVGDTVKRGDVVGRADSTGNSTGSHLHFSLKLIEGEQEVKSDMDKKYDWPYGLIDPTPFFKELR